MDVYGTILLGLLISGTVLLTAASAMEMWQERQNKKAVKEIETANLPITTDKAA